MRLIPLTDGIDISGTPPQCVVRYKACEIDNVNTAIAYAISETPSYVTTEYGVLFRLDVKVHRAAYNQWMVEVPYGPQGGEWTWSFDTTGGTVHITQAKEELRRYPVATAPNQLGAIAVDGDEVKGIEIVIPAMKINVEYSHPLGVMTLARAKFLANITGTTNSDTFLTFAPGEVLFLGANGSDGTTADAKVGYQFAMAANVVDQNIGGIGGVAKRAWEVAWIRYHDTVTTADGKECPTRVAKYVYVDRVYEEIAMAAALGFGG